MKAPAEERGESTRRAAPAPPRAALDPEPSTTEVRGTSGRPLSPAIAQRLQSAVGNRAVAALVAQRRAAATRTPAARSGGAASGPAVPAQRCAGLSTPATPSPSGAVVGGSLDAGLVEVAPVQRLAADAGPVHRPGPQADPKFAALKADVAGKQKVMSAHPPAKSEAGKAQGAAKPPQDDKEAQGKAANAEKMSAAKPGEFDKAAFVKAVNAAIAAQAPKNLDEADKFADSGKADAVKGQVQGRVGEGKKASAGAIETTTKAPPDTSAAKEKQVTPLVADRPPGTPGTPDPARAVPDKAPAAATDFSDGPRQVDQQMADAQVTEEQLAKSNEPEFTGALKEKKEGEKHAATAPGQVRAAEAQTLAGVKAAAGQAGAAAMAGLAADREQSGAQVSAGKEGAKSADEQKRAQVTARLQKVFDATKKEVEDILTGLDKKVDDQFTKGEKAARDAFTADYKRRIDAYKDKRYSGVNFWKWGKDKLFGLPDEVNVFYEQARKGYVDRMRQVISAVADTIGAELTRAKQRIAKGRDDLQAEVKKLGPDLQAIGKEAAAEFAGKFDELTESVDAKGKELVNTLATKYTEALKAVDEEIASEKEKNKGLVAKAMDAVGGVIKTIMQLKDMLLGVLAKAAQAVMAIISDPIGFLGNLVSSVGAGLKQFMANIGEHLKKGLVGWLLGAMSGAGLELPAKFDLRGIIMMIGSLLGLTWGAIRARIVQRGVPEQAMGAVEQSVPIAQKLQSQGIGGIWEDIKAQVGDLKANLFSKISEYLIPTVLIAGITWIISLLNPASAFIKACKMIIDIVTFIVNQGAQIIEFVNAVLDAIIAIAGGGTGGVPALIEKALARSVPVLIGALAAILGIGGIANKVRNFFQSLTKPVSKAVNWIVDKIVGFGTKIWAKLKNKVREKAGRNKAGSRDRDERTDDRKQRDLDAGLRAVTTLIRKRVPRPEIEERLPAIKARYRLQSLRLVVTEHRGSEDRVYAKGKVNPAGDGPEGLVPNGEGESDRERVDEDLTIGANTSGRPRATDPSFERLAAAFERRLAAKASSHQDANHAMEFMAAKAKSYLQTKLGGRWESADERLERILQVVGQEGVEKSGFVGTVVSDVMAVFDEGNLAERFVHLVRFFTEVLARDLADGAKIAQVDRFIEEAGMNLDFLLRRRQEGLLQLGPQGANLTRGIAPIPEGSDVKHQGDARVRRGEVLEHLDEGTPAYERTRDEHPPRTVAEVGLDFSARQEAVHRQANPGWNRERDVLKWVMGAKVWMIDETNEWVKAQRKLSLPLGGGPSGTTNTMMSAAKAFDADAYAARLACIAFLVGANHHTLVEIMAAAKAFGCDYEASQRIYRDVRPLTERELRACGEAGKFPDEMASGGRGSRS